MAGKELEKNYNPLESEQEIYRQWDNAGYFHPTPDETKEPFTIMMPPPNITGQLHLGHALQGTVQDTLIRYKRMRGYNSLYLPGTDHASIATEVRIIDAMAKEGLTKEDLGREGFLERAWQWKEEYGGSITQQQRKLGISCDWQRERFTMDDGCSRAVVEVFNRLYEKGLIYRGNRIINWCPTCRTALSDAEVEYEEEAGRLWHLCYPLADGIGSLIVATTRPETMLGDTAVAVHPKDTRYTTMIGKMVRLPLMDRLIPVIADTYVEKEFGTGVVKITPAHDPNDFEVGERHDLDQIIVMNEDGTMSAAAGKYAGLSSLVCREQVVSDMDALGLLIKVEDYTHNVGKCYRCSTTVEPLLSKQWFVSMKPLAEPANKAVREGSVLFVPERYSRHYFMIMDNIRDWCISRQLWWGHRIPAWYCDACEELVVARSAPHECPVCCGTMHQDEDVLDTWFSSALWPFSTLGWPEKTEDLSYFYPTSVLVTAYDIIFFWVARMIFSGIEQTGKPPFKYVVITGLVRDELGRKMSKSLGNGIDPIQVIDKFGADALRFSLTIGTTPGNDMRYSERKIEAARNFSNKIWNASRFVLLGIGDRKIKDVHEVRLDPVDGWILTRLSELIRDVTHHLDAFETGMSAGLVYDFIWSNFCDWYIEWAKQRLYGTDEDAKDTVIAVLMRVLKDSLKLMHPFMPFLTERIWQSLPDTEHPSIMMTRWPEDDALFHREQDARDIEDMMEIIRAVRNIRAEKKVTQGRRTRVLLVPVSGNEHNLSTNSEALVKLAYASEVNMVDKAAIPKGTASAVCRAAEVFLPLEDLVDIEQEKARLAKEIARLQEDIEKSSARMSNPGFIGKAPATVIEKEKAALEEKKDRLDRSIAQQAALYE